MFSGRKCDTLGLVSAPPGHDIPRSPKQTPTGHPRPPPAMNRSFRTIAYLALIGAVAADLVAEAIVRAVQAATSLHGIPAIRDLRGAA